MGRRRKKKLTIKSEETTTTFGVLALISSAILVLSEFFSNSYFDKVHIYLGQGVIFSSILLFIFALRMFGNKYRFNSLRVIVGLSLTLFSFLGFLQLYKYNNSVTKFALINGGGEVGKYIANISLRYFPYEISLLLLVLIIILSFIWGLSIPLNKIFSAIRDVINWITNLFMNYIFPLFSKIITSINEYFKNKKDKDSSKDKKDNKIVETKKDEVINVSPMMVGDLSGRNVLPSNVSSTNETTHEVDAKGLEHKTIVADEEFSDWKYPTVELLNKPDPYVVQDENVKKNSDIIEKTLESFGILAKVADVKIGPVITQYALQITMGTKVAKINNLNKDLALALAASSGMVRVEAPIPGTSLVGIELPNAHPRTIKIRELFESKDAFGNGMKLPIALGRDVAGNIIIRDLQKMPHLLIAGSTGSGKSVTVNSFIISLLFRYSPNELKLILVDPKQVELSQYNGIPHLLVPVITEMEKVVNALKWAIVEMENRYKMFKQEGVRNIESYNQKKDNIPIPYIVIVIDEMADLMMVQGVEVENCIVRLAQMARAVGIHLILATQRPSVNIITGLIKANIPARIGMSVTSIVDSRVILDSSGAETLLGKGDMLFKQPDSIRPMRIQGVMVTDDEIERVLVFIKKQSPEVQYSEEVTQGREDEKKKVSGMWEDNLFPDAVRVVVNAGRGSASILQSKLRIGYARAARLIEELEDKGVVGPADGSKPRDVLVVDPEVFLSQSNNENSK